MATNVNLMLAELDVQKARSAYNRLKDMLEEASIHLRYLEKNLELLKEESGKQ